MQSKICVMTSYTTDFSDMGDYAAMCLRLYAKKHKLDCCVMSEIVLDRPPAWHRVQLFLDMFDKGYDYVFWHDADAIFTRFDVDLRSIINDRAHLYMVQHEHPDFRDALVPNTGVMLMKNSEWSKSLLTKLWSMEEYLNHPWWENAAMIKLMGYDSLLHEGANKYNHDMLERIEFISDDRNYIPSICTIAHPIIKHYAGHPNEIRRKEMPKDALMACFSLLSEISM